MNLVESDSAFVVSVAKSAITSVFTLCLAGEGNAKL